MFITFEGIDGSGKGTLIKGVKEVLRNEMKLQVTLTREPGGTALGTHLRTLLLDSQDEYGISPMAEMLMYAADRAQHLEVVIKPALDMGYVVLCDRYMDSTYAYQGGGRGHSLEMLRSLFRLSCGGEPLYPHITFILDLPVEMGLDRAMKRNSAEGKDLAEGKFEALDIDFHRRVRQMYLYLAQDTNFKHYYTLDASQTPEEVLYNAMSIIRRHLP